VELVIPPDAKKGQYEGEVRLYLGRMLEPESYIGALPFVIDVRGFSMPSPRDYEFHLDLWQHISNIARKHEVELWGDSHFHVLARYVQSLADLGQKAVSVIVSEIPWRGQRCYREKNNPSNLFEYSMVRIVREASGTFTYDYSAMQRYIDLCFSCGIDKEIEVFGLVNIWVDEEYGLGKVCSEYPDGITLRYLDCSDGCYKYMDHAGDIADYIKALESYFRTRNLLELVRIAADEPENIIAYRKSAEKLLSISPAFRLKTAINHSGFIDGFKESISDFVPFISCLGREFGMIQQLKSCLDNKRFLWYICCGPDHPNTFIHNHLLESRFIGILTYYLGLDGFLRWNYTVWPDEPRKCIKYGSFPAGDTNFVYPSNNGSVLLSLRYKNLKRGIEDFELLRLAERHGKIDAIKKALGPIIKEKDITHYYRGNEDEILPIGEICSLEFSEYSHLKSLLIDALNSDE
jgi:hypothetical protein